MREEEIFLTVCTPVFNGEKTIHRVYDSLLKQDMQSFEWLIVNDGSTDKTEAKVKSFISQGKLNITLINQENLHKKIAVSNGIKHAKGQMFLVADADDEIMEGAFSTFYNEWNKIPDKENFSGICGLCIDEYESLVGTSFPSSPLDCNSIEMRLVYKVKGEKWGVGKTSLLRATYPDYSKFKKGHVPEGIFQRKMDIYKTRFINVIVRKYYTNSNNSITNSELSDHDALGVCLDALDWLDNYNKYFFLSPLHFMKKAISYHIYKSKSSHPPPKVKTLFTFSILAAAYPFFVLVKLIRAVKR